MQTYGDDQIIEGIRKADPIVLEFIYNNYFKAIRAIVKKQSRNDDDAWDVFQDTINYLIDIIQKKDKDFSLREASFGTFFIEIGKRIWIDRLKKSGRFVLMNNLPDTDLSETEETEMLDSQDVEANTLLRIYRKHLDNLHPDCKYLITMLMNEKDGAFMAKKLQLKSTQVLYNKKRSCIKKLIRFVINDPEYINIKQHGKSREN